MTVTVPDDGKGRGGVPDMGRVGMWGVQENEGKALSENGGASGEAHGTAGAQGLNEQVFRRTDTCARGLRVGEGKGVPSVSAARARRFPEVRCVRAGAGEGECKPEVRGAEDVGRERRNDV